MNTHDWQRIRSNARVSSDFGRKSRWWERVLDEECGILTLEWTFLIMLLVIGIVGGVAVLRDAINVRYYYAVDAFGAANASYEISEYESRLTQNGQTLFTSAGTKYGSEDTKTWVAIKPD